MEQQNFLQALPNKNNGLYLMALCLTGSNEQRERSMVAFAEFRVMILPACTWHQDIDYNGFPVFRVAFWVPVAMDIWAPDVLIRIWEKHCEQYGIKPATSYEKRYYDYKMWLPDHLQKI